MPSDGVRGGGPERPLWSNTQSRSVGPTKRTEAPWNTRQPSLASATQARASRTSGAEETREWLRLVASCRRNRCLHKSTTWETGSWRLFILLARSCRRQPAISWGVMMTASVERPRMARRTSCPGSCGTMPATRPRKLPQIRVSSVVAPTIPNHFCIRRIQCPQRAAGSGLHEPRVESRDRAIGKKPAQRCATTDYGWS